MMKKNNSVQAMLERIGGGQLQEHFAQEGTKVAQRKSLPHAADDIYSYSYCIVIGGLAALADGILDNMFRKEMQEIHKELEPEEQLLRENMVKDYLNEQGLNPESGPTMSMDYYKDLNEELDLKSGFKLRPSNHRILNHTA